MPETMTCGKTRWRLNLQPPDFLSRYLSAELSLTDSTKLSLTYEECFTSIFKTSLRARSYSLLLWDAKGYFTVYDLMATMRRYSVKVTLTFHKVRSGITTEWRSFT